MPIKEQYQQFRMVEQAIIPLNSDTSSAIDLHGTYNVGIITPSSLTSTKFHFQVSIDGINFFDMYDGIGNGTLKEFGIGANRAISLHDALHTIDFPIIRLKTNATELGERVFKLILSSI